MNTSTQARTDSKAAWRTQALLRAMSADYLLREQFATDPMQVYCDYVAPGRSEQKVEAANQLIFSVFSSPQLRRWMGEYSRRLGGRMSSQHVFATQFASAAASSRDPLVTLALVRGAAAGEGRFELLADFFRAVLAAMGRGGVGASGTEMSPGATATEMSPGATATEMSPGALGLAGRIASEIASATRFAVELRRLASAGGTEMSPGSGTEKSPGGTEMSPGRGTERSPGGTEMSPGRGTERSPGGTEMSPGRGTERSPGGTEMSPGRGTEKSPGGTEMSPGALRLAQSLVGAIRRAERFSEMLLRAEGGTEMSPGTATEMSPGVTATEMSPGASRLSLQLITEIKIAVRLSSQLLAAEGTEMSPGGGTEMSPGKAGHIEALTAVLRRAELFSVELLRLSEGTEMSPGTATEMSPGVTATEMSPGAARFSIAERLQAELASAARFSAEIIRAQSGTEMSPGRGTEQSPGGTEMSPGALRLTEGLFRAVQGAQRLGQLLVRSEQGTEMSPGVTATEMSPGATATEMSPGARLSARLATEINVAARYASALRKSAHEGTEMSPGGGTEQSPGNGTEMSLGAGLNVAQLLAASVRRSQLFLGEILRVAEGTEMSPGSTEISPGGGTEISPGGTEVSPGTAFGGLWGVQLPAQVAMALGALVQYAVVLRRQGALDSSGLERG